MRSQYDALDERTLTCAVQVVAFAQKLDRLPVLRWLVKQFVDSGTSVAANQRAARRARSNRELAAKLSIIVEEADELVFWCELLKRLSLSGALLAELEAISNEAMELRAIYAKGRATVRFRLLSTQALTLLAVSLVVSLCF